jgi:hypothetical protein
MNLEGKKKKKEKIVEATLVVQRQHISFLNKKKTANKMILAATKKTHYQVIKKVA